MENRKKNTLKLFSSVVPIEPFTQAERNPFVKTLTIKTFSILQPSALSLSPSFRHSDANQNQNENMCDEMSENCAKQQQNGGHRAHYTEIEVRTNITANLVNQNRGKKTKAFALRQQKKREKTHVFL